MAGGPAGVLEAAVAEVRQRSDGPITAVLGPCIHPECYEFSAADLEPIAARLGPEVAGRRPPDGWRSTCRWRWRGP